MLHSCSKRITLPEVDENHPGISLLVDQEPFVKPTAFSRRIIIIGGGISGLMTAWILLDKEYLVTILSKEWARPSGWQDSRLTSQVAGALWEYPPGGCGLTEVESPGEGWANIAHYREWALESYELYKKLDSLLSGQVRTESGVSISKLTQFFYHDLSQEVELNSNDFLKLEAIRKVAGHGQRIDNLKEHSLQDLEEIFDDLDVDQAWRTKLKAGYTHDTPIINTGKGMDFLMSLVKAKGADLETREIEGALIPSSANRLAVDYDAAAIINATGPSAKRLAQDDDVYPVRGAVKRMQNKDTDSFRGLKQTYLIPAQKNPHDGQATDVIFLVPRGDETLIVGSIIQPNNDTLNLTEISPEVERMWQRAQSFLPPLNDIKLIDEYPLAQGLRPFTRRNVKVRAEEMMGKESTTAETDTDTDTETEAGAAKKAVVIHNYGHGGSGWTLAVGCARSAAYLLELMLVQHVDAKEANRKLYSTAKR